MKIKIITVVTVILLLVIMSVTVYAETPIPDPPYGSYQYWVVADSYGATMLYTSPNPIRVDTSENHFGLHLYICKNYKLINGQWSYEKEFSTQVIAGFNTIYAANHDIAYRDGSGFFFTLPKVSELSQIVRQMKNKGTFGTVLRNFSAGLIPLVGCLILVISLRKGWGFLRTQLSG